MPEKLEAKAVARLHGIFAKKLLAMMGLCFVLVVALDQTVNGTALPTVVAELTGFDLYAWVGTSYLLT